MCESVGGSVNEDLLAHMSVTALVSQPMMSALKPDAPRSTFLEAVGEAIYGWNEGE